MHTLRVEKPEQRRNGTPDGRDAVIHPEDRSGTDAEGESEVRLCESQSRADSPHVLWTDL